MNLIRVSIVWLKKQVCKQVLVSLSPYELTGQRCTHMFVLLSPYILGFYGHKNTHFIVLGSAYVWVNIPLIVILGHEVHDLVTLSAYKPDLGLHVYAQSPVILSLKNG